MARSIGEVYITVLANTKQFNDEAKAAAREAGDASGQSFAREFNKRMNDPNSGVLAGLRRIDYSRALDDFADRWAVRWGQMSKDAQVDLVDALTDARIPQVMEPQVEEFKRYWNVSSKELADGLGQRLVSALDRVRREQERNRVEQARWNTEVDRTIGKYGEAWDQVTQVWRTIQDLNLENRAGFGEGEDFIRRLNIYLDEQDTKIVTIRRSSERLEGVFRRLRLSLRRAGTGGWFDSFTNFLAVIPGSLGAMLRLSQTVSDYVQKPFELLGRTFFDLSEKGGRLGSVMGTLSGVFFSLGKAAGPIGAAVMIGAMLEAIALLIAALPVLAAAISTAVGALTLFGVGIANAAAGLVLLTPAIPALAAGLGVLVLGFKGVGGAISNFNKVLDETDPEKRAEALDAYAESLDKISPAAADAVRALEPFVEQFRELRGLVQERLFEGLAEQIPGLQGAFDVFGEGLLRVADALVVIRDYAIEVFTSQDQLDAWSGAWEITAGVLEDLGVSIVNFVAGLIELFTGTKGPILDVSEGIRQTSERFKEWAGDETNQQKLSGFFDTAKEALGTVLDILGSIGDVFAPIFRTGSDDAQTMLEKIDQLFSDLAAWIEEAAADGRLQQWFDDAMVAAGAFKDLLVTLFEIFDRLDTPQSRAWLTGILDAITLVMDGLQPFIEVLTWIVEVLFDKLAVGFEVAAAAFELIGKDEQAERLRGIAESLRTSTEAADELAAPRVFDWPAGLLDQLVTLKDEGVLTNQQLDFLVNERDTPNFPSTMYQDLLTLVAQGEITDEQLAVLVGERKVPGYTGDITQDLIALEDQGIITSEELDAVVAERDTPTYIPTMETDVEGLGGAAKTTSGALNTMMSERARNLYPEVLRADLAKATSEAGRAKQAIDRIPTSRTVNVTVSDNGTVRNLQYRIDNIRGRTVTVKIAGTSGTAILGAEGGLFNQPTNAIIGEAGPEALIPLTRPLSQIDPSVREMAAILRGQAAAPNSGGPQRVNYVTLNVYPTQANPVAVAHEVMDHLVTVTR